MKRLFWLVVCLFVIIGFTNIAKAETKANLTWDANTESDLAGYKVYQGIASGSYGVGQSIGNTATHSATLTIPCGEDVTFFFAVTALDTSGNESGFSNEVAKTFNALPCAPQNFSITIQVTINFSKEATDLLAALKIEN